jgi:hypothetical protein
VFVNFFGCDCQGVVLFHDLNTWEIYATDHPISKLNLSRVADGYLGVFPNAITENLATRAQSSVLPVISFIESRESYEFKLDLVSARDAKFEINEVQGMFKGILVNGSLMPMPTGFVTVMKSCKIHRKSRFIIICLTKQFGWPLFPQLNFGEMQKGERVQMERIGLIEINIRNDVY